MLAQQKPVRLSLVSLDLPIWFVVETNATLYQKDQEQFHLILTEPLIQDFSRIEDEVSPLPPADPTLLPPSPRLLWLEISPYRVIMTMQGNGRFSYRHFWEQGVYGVSRYWLQSAFTTSDQLRLRNFTRCLAIEGKPEPRYLRIEYELWASQIQIGSYVMDLEIQS